MIRFEIPGEQVPMPRPIVTRDGRGHIPSKVHKYEQLVATQYKAAGGTVHGGPVAVTIAFWFQMAKSWPKYKKRDRKGMPKTDKPDLDNVVKTILDGLNKVAYEDDAQVYKIHAVKHWYDGEPLTIVQVEGAEEE